MGDVQTQGGAIEPKGEIQITKIMDKGVEICTRVSFSSFEDFKALYSKGDLGKIVESQFDPKYDTLYDDRIGKDYFAHFVSSGDKRTRFHARFDIFQKRYTATWNIFVQYLASIDVQTPSSRVISDFFSKINKEFSDYLEKVGKDPRNFMCQLGGLGSRTEADFRVQLNIYKILRREKGQILLDRGNDYKKIDIYRLEDLTVPQYFLMISRAFNHAIKSKEVNHLP